MTRRAIDARDLDPTTRARLGLTGEQGATRRQIGEHLQGKRRERGERDEHAIARKRGHSGKLFESSLALTHRQYEMLRWGKLWPHSPPFVRIKGEWLPKKGGGPVDYTGHVCVGRHFGDGAVTVTGCRTDFPGAQFVPVAFDAKVGDTKSAVYHHEQKRQHQLHTLRDASAAGVVAFLLVLAPQLDPPHGRLFAIDVAAHFRDLITSGVRLFDPVPRGRTGEPFLLLPSIGIRATREIAEWDWIPLLGWLTNGPAGPG